MAEIRLSPLRIGFGYSTGVDFPAGFLDVGESVRMKLRRYVGAEPAFAMTSTREVDHVHLALTAEQTADMEPGTYVGEMVMYAEADPTSETPLTRNVYLVEANYSLSE